MHTRNSSKVVFICIPYFQLCYKSAAVSFQQVNPASAAPGIIQVASPQAHWLPQNIPDFPVHVTITKYLTQLNKLLHANQPITAMGVHNIICHQEFHFFDWFRRQMTHFFVREGQSSFQRQNGSKFSPRTQ